MEKRGGTGRKRVTGAGEDGERESGRSVVDWVDWKIRIGWRIQASGSMPMYPSSEDSVIRDQPHVDIIGYIHIYIRAEDSVIRDQPHVAIMEE